MTMLKIGVSYGDEHWVLNIPSMRRNFEELAEDDTMGLVGTALALHFQNTFRNTPTIPTIPAIKERTEKEGE